MNSQKWIVAWASVAAALLAGCVTVSVYPYFTRQDLTFDPALAGRWARVEDRELWTIATNVNQSYLVTVAGSNETNRFEGHLFHLKSHQFLDLLITNRVDFQMPVHVVARVGHAGTELDLGFLNYGWLADYLVTNPAVLRHLVVPEDPADTNHGMMFLTAETRDLQKFLLKHLADTNAFSPESAVTLMPAAP